MKLKVIHATSNCAESSCPTIYQTPEGNFIFQGFKISSSIKSDHGVPNNEDMVELPKEFVQTFLEKSQA